jgi:hypothetical protein
LTRARLCRVRLLQVNSLPQRLARCTLLAWLVKNTPQHPSTQHLNSPALPASQRRARRLSPKQRTRYQLLRPRVESQPSSACSTMATRKRSTTRCTTMTVAVSRQQLPSFSPMRTSARLVSIRRWQAFHQRPIARRSFMACGSLPADSPDWIVPPRRPFGSR